MAMAQPWYLSIVARDALTIPQKPGHHRAFFLPVRDQLATARRAEMIASH